MSKTKKVISLIVAFSILSVVIFSSAFVICNSCHACTGHNCVVCYNILVCAKNMTKFSVFIYMLLFVGFMSLFAIHLDIIHKKKHFFKTPVSLKVKLLN